jgi:hypothetical protein
MGEELVFTVTNDAFAQIIALLHQNFGQCDRTQITPHKAIATALNTLAAATVGFQLDGVFGEHGLDCSECLDGS